MTMTETPVEAPKKPRPAKKKAKKRVVVAKPAAKPSSEFEGITPSDCPMACRADRCVISGRGICAHPHKGGLQANMQNPEAMRRYNGAKRALGKRKLDLTADE